ncbi:MAG: hypothetical protein RL150_502 [Candidatus Parcubacteria bacterium]
MLVALLPIFFLPGSIASPTAAKMMLLYGVGGLALVVLMVRRLLQAERSLPLSWPMAAASFVGISVVLAGLTSMHLHASFFGRDLAQDTVIAIVFLLALAAVTAYAFRNVAWSMYAYATVLVTGFVTMLVHLLHVYIPALPSFGFFTAPTVTTLGKWNELGIYAALLIMLSLAAQITMMLSGRARLFLYAVTVVSIIGPVLAPMFLVWMLLGMGSLALGIVALLRSPTHPIAKTTIGLLVAVFVLACLFVVFGQRIAAPVQNSSNVQHLEIQLPLHMTIAVAQQSLAGSRIITGVGPALFEQQWALYRPESMLATVFWNVDFRHGFGLLPTFLVTTGLLGMLSWICMTGTLLVITVRTVVCKAISEQEHFLITSGAILSWFLWIVCWVYVPTVSLFALTFIITGLFVSTAYRNGAYTVHSILFTKPVLRIGSRIMCACALGLVLVGGVLMVQKSIAQVYFQRSVVASAVPGQAAESARLLDRALAFDPLDTYYELRGRVEGVLLQQVLAGATVEQPIDPTDFAARANRAIEYFRSALTYDSRNYSTQIASADFYTVLTGYGVSGAYESAKQLYSDALTFKPRNPVVYLGLARLELANKDVLAARAAIDEALNIKANYSDAYLLLTQIELSQNNKARALEVLKRAGVQNPNDPFIYFQIGLLAYYSDTPSEAILALERAVSLDSHFQNARYFLGLSYYAAGEIPSALRQFEVLQAQNPGMTELNDIVENLRAGRPPISDKQALEGSGMLP